MATNFTLKDVRFALCFVYDPSEKSGKYSCRVLIDKSNKEDLETLANALSECMKDKKTLATFGGKIPAKYDNVVRDGDEEFPDDPVYKGKIFFNASNKNKPQIIDKHGIRLESDDEFWSGCYGAFNGSYYGYDKMGNKGFAISLDNILKLREGERLTGGMSARQAFSSMLEDDSNPFAGRF